MRNNDRNSHAPNGTFDVTGAGGIGAAPTHTDNLAALTFHMHLRVMHAHSIYVVYASSLNILSDSHVCPLQEREASEQRKRAAAAAAAEKAKLKKRLTSSLLVHQVRVVLRLLASPVFANKKHAFHVP
jgi:hypothetical protein